MAAYVFIGDDFTGASDTLATLAERGWRTRLFLGVPDARLVEQEKLDAVGVATDLRALGPEASKARLAGILPAITALRPRYLHYKVCSTFDSAPMVGSIGAAVLAIEEHIEPAFTLVLGGQPSLGRFCIFGNLFARGPDGAIHRIDRHPIMSRHPTTPMHEADLRIHLKAQGLGDLTWIERPGKTDSSAAIASMLNLEKPRALIDLIDQADIETLGEALIKLPVDAPMLLVGASSVAEAVSGSRKPAPHPQNTHPSVDGPRLVVAGSRSSATAQQVGAATHYMRLPLAAEDLAEPGFGHIGGRAAEGLGSGTHVLLHLQPQLDYGLSPERISEKLALLAASILERCPVRAIGVAGGDTSSAVVHRLGFRSLTFEKRAGHGVAICRGGAPGSRLDGARLLLKGGQLGSVDLFDQFALG